MDIKVAGLFFISDANVTLNQGQGHPNWYEKIELSIPYHHTKFEISQSVNVWKQANIKGGYGGGEGGGEGLRGLWNHVSMDRLFIE